MMSHVISDSSVCMFDVLSQHRLGRTTSSTGSPDQDSYKWIKLQQNTHTHIVYHTMTQIFFHNRTLSGGNVLESTQAVALNGFTMEMKNEDFGPIGSALNVGDKFHLRMQHAGM